MVSLMRWCGAKLESYRRRRRREARPHYTFFFNTYIHTYNNPGHDCRFITYSFVGGMHSAR
jgi:hypothetical protein